MKHKLDHLALISASGIEHPYYGASLLHSGSVDDMHLRVTSHPPLDYATTVPHDRSFVDFVVLVEAEDASSKWEVDLWHNHNSNDESQWQDLRLVPGKSFAFCPSMSKEKPLARHWYTGRLTGKSLRPVSFTVRFRAEGEAAWRWVKDQTAAGDGQLIFQQPPSAILDRDDLSHYIGGLSPDLEIKNVPSQTANTTLWSLTMKAEPAKGDTSGYSAYDLGVPYRLKRWFSIVRLWSPWIAPRQGRMLPLAERDAILYSFLRDDGIHVAAIAISGIDDILTVFRFERDRLVISTRNDREETGNAIVGIAVGNSFDEAFAAVIYFARSVVTTSTTAPLAAQSIPKEVQLRDEPVRASWIQDWYDGFSFCTWNSLGQNLTEEKILGALESLKQNGITITNLIIDDNWQSLDNEGKNQMFRGWTDFEANPQTFPRGLKATVSTIRQTYPTIKHVCVWHALLGYWGAISPTGKIAQTYKTIRVKKEDNTMGEYFTVVDAPDVKRFYDDFYSFLLSAGVDAAKTDAQFFLDKMEAAPVRRSLIHTYLSTWTQAQLRHLSGISISCMSQTPQILFSCQLPTNSPPIPVRNSDDFFPDSEGSHPWHIFCNAHNALLARHLNVLPDWDMFQTKHKWSGFHAAGRCISGGPIYITDEPGKHDVDLIFSMTARTSRGQMVILRPSVIGRSVEAYVGYEDQRFCRVAAYDGGTGTGSSFMAVFNCRDHPITEIISLSDFIGVEKGTKYAVKHHHPPKSILGIIDTEDLGAAIFGLNLPGHGWDVLSASPVYGPYDVSEDMKGLSVANLGLLGKMTGAAAVISTEVSIHGPSAKTNPTPGGNVDRPPRSSQDPRESGYSRLRIRTVLKALGTLGLLIPKIEEMDWKERILVLLEGMPMPVQFARKSENDAGLLELDVEGAWKHLNLESGWSNEVDVEVFVG